MHIISLTTNVIIKLKNTDNTKGIVKPNNSLIKWKLSFESPF